MGEYAPQAIRDLYDALDLPGKQMSGILGDSAHTYGYHRGRNYVSSGDYSTEAPPDQLGDGEAAAALDVSLGPDQMIAVSAQLMGGMQARDPRLAPVREFFGTIDGYNVTGWDAYENCYTSSDDSHLWHIHLSIYRQWTNDYPTLSTIADFINGTPSGSSGGFLMSLTDQQQSDIYNWLADMNTRHGIEAVRNIDDGAIYVLASDGWVHVDEGLHDYFTQMRMYTGGSARDINGVQFNNLIATMGGGD